MSTVAADTLGARSAARPALDHRPSRSTVVTFLVLLVAGCGYAGYSLVSDISSAAAQALTLLPFLLLGVALLIALGFEFVNGGGRSISPPSSSRCGSRWRSPSR